MEKAQEREAIGLVGEYENKCFLSSQNYRVLFPHTTSFMSKLGKAFNKPRLLIDDKLVLNVYENNLVSQRCIGFSFKQQKSLCKLEGAQVFIKRFTPHRIAKLKAVALYIFVADDGAAFEATVGEIKTHLRGIMRRQVFCKDQRFGFQIRTRLLEALVIEIKAKEMVDMKMVGKEMLSTGVFGKEMQMLGQAMQPKEMQPKEDRPKFGIVGKKTALEINIQTTSRFKLTGAEEEESLWREDVNINNVDELREKLKNIGLGGMTELVRTILYQAFSSPQLYKENGEDMTHQRGLLLYGPPGCGKTFLACKISLLLRSATVKVVRGSELKVKWNGVTEQKIRELFQEAIEDDKLNGPNSKLHIIIIDELDAMTLGRDSGNSSLDNCLVSQFLSMLDGPESTNNIFIIATTNRPDLIDPAFKRGGRFGMHFEVRYPDQASRIEMINVILQRSKDNYRLADDVNYEEIADLTNGFAASALGELLVRANACAFKRNNYNILDLKYTREDFVNAIGEIQATMEEVKGEREYWKRISG